MKQQFQNLIYKYYADKRILNQSILFSYYTWKSGLVIVCLQYNTHKKC